mmetsp:Transcript_9180/g.14563  ORF Transcript_9180/g.14563 Transcript_9180/m.14563 type:complete len:300 (+) Transcript_9180:50-949(+)
MMGGYVGGAGCTLGSRMHLLVFLLAVVAAGAQDEDEETEPSVPQPFNPREAIAQLAQYDHAHPGFLQGVAIWIAIGVVLYIIALTGLLYSEIRTCLVVRDRDFRVRLLHTQACLPGSRLADLKENENALLAPRAYITFAMTLLFVVAIAAFMFPLCDVFTIIGLPSGPCLLMLTIGALLAAICTVSGWMALVWSCTRPYAAFVLASVSLFGQLLVPTGNLLLILVWIMAAGMGGMLYFYYLPGMYSDKQWARPGWMQDVGVMSVSFDPKEWSNSFSRSYEAHEAEISKDEELSIPSSYQ